MNGLVKCFQESDKENLLEEKPVAAAYTNRPTSSVEILKKKRTTTQAAPIFQFVENTYDSGIVLQPNTPFKKIKVFREVEKKITKKKLLEALSKAKINLTGLTIEYGNGSGGGKGGGSRGGTEVTALAESMQCYYNSYYWEKGITAPEPTEVQLKAQESFCDTDRSLSKCLTANEIKSWRDDNVFDKIAIELKGRFNTIFKSRPTFHRGSDFMKNIYKAKATVHKNDKKAARDNSPPTLPQAPGSFRDDKWNPGDIWMTTLSSDSKPLEDHVCTWGSLNDEVVHLANTGKMMGVSLKRVNTPRARTTFFNKKRKKEQQKYTGFTFGKRGDFFNSIDCYLHGSTCMIQCRTTDVYKSWQGEVSAAAAAGGKIGGGNIDFFLNDVFGENMFGSMGEQGVIQDTMKAIQEGLDLNHLKSNLFLNEFYSLYNKFAPLSGGDEKLKNPTTEDEFLEKLNTPPPNTKYTTKGFLVSKYLCMKMLEVMFGSGGSQVKRDHLMTLFCLYAMSSSNQSSFFIKIS